MLQTWRMKRNMTSALRTAYTGRHQPLQKATFVSNQANFSFLFSIISLMIIFCIIFTAKLVLTKKKCEAPSRSINVLSGVKTPVHQMGRNNTPKQMFLALWAYYLLGTCGCGRRNFFGYPEMKPKKQ